MHPTEIWYKLDFFFFFGVVSNNPPEIRNILFIFLFYYLPGRVLKNASILPRCGECRNNNNYDINKSVSMTSEIEQKRFFLIRITCNVISINLNYVCLFIYLFIVIVFKFSWFLFISVLLFMQEQIDIHRCIVGGDVTHIHILLIISRGYEVINFHINYFRKVVIYFLNWRFLSLFIYVIYLIPY